MMRDIFATSMGGTFEMKAADTLIETGRWSYQGYGNAEIGMEAEGEILESGLRYSLRIHSAEYQMGSVNYRAVWSEDGEEVIQEFQAEIVGVDVKIKTTRGSETFDGDLTIPDATIFDGPSPIWMIHTMLTTPPPGDRQITAPVAVFDPKTGGVVGGLFRFQRTGSEVAVTRMDEDGDVVDHLTIHLADDGCPQSMHARQWEMAILRTPHSADLHASEGA